MADGTTACRLIRRWLLVTARPGTSRVCPHIQNRTALIAPEWVFLVLFFGTAAAGGVALRRTATGRAAKINDVRGLIPLHAPDDVTVLRGSIAMGHPAPAFPMRGVVVVADRWIGFELADGNTYLLTRADEVAIVHNHFGQFFPGSSRHQTEKPVTSFSTGSLTLSLGGNSPLFGVFLSYDRQDEARAAIVAALAKHSWGATGPTAADTPADQQERLSRHGHDTRRSGRPW